MTKAVSSILGHLLELLRREKFFSFLLGLKLGGYKPHEASFHRLKTINKKSWDLGSERERQWGWG